MTLTTQERMELINRISALPKQLEALVKDLTEQELEAHPQGEWTVRQNVHHLADAHTQALSRMKFALTQDKPGILLYNQDAWAALADGKQAPIADSLAMLRGLHGRMVVLLESLDEAGWQREYIHPERGPQTMEKTAALYAGHGERHLQQIREALATIGK
jgi:DinB superfamily